MGPTAEDVRELHLEFESLVHAERTTIHWERAEFTGIELVYVELEGTGEMDELIEVERDIWAQFLDVVLNQVLWERSASAEVAADTQPEIKTLDALEGMPDIGRHSPDAPTSPKRTTAETFLRCSVSIVMPSGRRARVIEGPAVMNLYSQVYGFARETGLDLPG